MRGFSFIEVLIALALLCFMALGSARGVVWLVKRSERDFYLSRSAAERGYFKEA